METSRDKEPQQLCLGFVHFARMLSHDMIAGWIDLVCVGSCMLHVSQYIRFAIKLLFHINSESGLQGYILQG